MKNILIALALGMVLSAPAMADEDAGSTGFMDEDAGSIGFMDEDAGSVGFDEDAGSAG